MGSPEVRNMVNLKNISKSYGVTHLFTGVDLGIHDGDRIGVLGPNGCGKTTLLKIIYGIEQPDRGMVTVGNTTKIGYLPQDFSEYQDQLVADLIEQQQGDFNSATFMSRKGRVLRGLDLDRINPERLVGSLSSGERSRVWLGKLLLEDPNVYLLDEPTNHLDLAALDWLESFIKNEKSAFVVVSHDRFFLDRIVRSVLSYNPQHRTFRQYKGNYSSYLSVWEKERERYREEYNRQQEEIKEAETAISQSRHTLKYGSHGRRKDHAKLNFNYRAQRGMGATTGKIRQTKHRLEVLRDKEIPSPVDQWKIQPVFPREYQAGDSVLSIGSLVHSYGDLRVLSGISAEVSKGDKVAIMGPNGVGKTTLLKIIAGLTEPDSGMVRLGTSIKPGYMWQEHEDLDFDKTVLEEYRQGLVGLEEELRRDLWIYGLFGPEDVGKKIENLSPGQRARLIIAKMVARGVNFLLLDEPTNHLDVDSQEQFQESINAFQGPVLLVSHDRWFVDKIANGIWFLSNGKLQKQLGNYSENQEWLKGNFNRLTSPS